MIFLTMSKFVNIQIASLVSSVYVEADDSLCYSILGNLIKNVVEAAPEHSEVRIIVLEDVEVQLCMHNQGDGTCPIT
jgi:signal transduction histidine kinase